jgi:hypothetical protein
VIVLVVVVVVFVRDRTKMKKIRKTRRLRATNCVIHNEVLGGVTILDSAAACAMSRWVMMNNVVAATAVVFSCRISSVGHFLWTDWLMQK